MRDGEVAGARRQDHGLLQAAVAPKDHHGMAILRAGVGKGAGQGQGAVLLKLRCARNDAGQDRRNVFHRHGFGASIHVGAVLVHQRDADRPASLIRIDVRHRARRGEGFHRTAIAPRDTVLRHRVRTGIGDRS